MSNKIKTILFFDHNWSQIARLIRIFAKSISDSKLSVIMLSDRLPSSNEENLEVINILDVPQRKTLLELQSQYDSSLHRAIVPERAFYDYSSFRKTQCYSSLSEEEIEVKVTPYINALDFVIREKADVMIDWFPDNFISSVSQAICQNYSKRCNILLPLYWWSDGAVIIDRANMTSSVIDKNYETLINNAEMLAKCDLSYIHDKKQTFVYKQSKMHLWKDRYQLIVNREKSYQPVSLLNWIIRKISRVLNRFALNWIVKKELHPREEPFVVFPLHISPEASILSTDPELADQFWLIKNISMNLPYGVKLYVKQHPYEDLGAGLNYDFYSKVASLPNVRIFDRKSSMEELINHPSFLAIALLSGHAAIEAALKSKPVFIFGTSYLSIADCFIKPKDFFDFFHKLRLIMEGKFEFNQVALNAILGALDMSVVKADVDMSSHDNVTGAASQLPPIWKAFVESL